MYDENVTHGSRPFHQEYNNNRGRADMRTASMQDPRPQQLGDEGRSIVQVSSSPQTPLKRQASFLGKVSDFVFQRPVNYDERGVESRSKHIDSLNDKIEHLDRKCHQQEGIIARLRRVEQDAKSDIGHIKKLQSENRKLDVSNKQLSRNFNNRRSWLQLLQKEVERLKQAKSELAMSVGDLEVEVQQLRAERRSDLIKIQQLNKERQTHVAEIQRLQSERQNDLSKIRIVQESAFAQTDNGPWAPQDDAEVRRQFVTLDKSIQKWSKKFAAASLESFLVATPDSVSRFLQDAKYFMPSGMGARISIDLAAINMQSKAVIMLLQAWVSFTVYRIVGSPFFFVNTRKELEKQQNSSQYDSQELDVRTVLGDLLNDIWLCDQHRGTTWRAELLRLYQPIADGKQHHTERIASDSMRKLTVIAISESCNVAAEKFLKEASVFLHKDNEDAARQSLRDIFIQAGVTSYKLWTRKDELEIRTLHDLDQPLFFSKAVDMQHHPLHEALLDEDATALDGQPIVLTLSPVIMVRSKHQDSREYRTRIWKKAIVYMGACTDSCSNSKAASETSALKKYQSSNSNTATKAFHGAANETFTQGIITQTPITREELAEGNTFIKAEPMDLH